VEKYDKKTPDNADTCNLYVKSFPIAWGSRELEDFFARFGKVTSAKVELDKNKLSRQFGFLSFEHSESGNLAIKELHGTRLEGETEPLYVGIFENKSERFKKQTKDGKADPNNKRNLYVK